MRQWASLVEKVGVEIAQWTIKSTHGPWWIPVLERKREKLTKKVGLLIKLMLFVTVLTEL